jgi:hypothetical protein
MFIPDHSVSDRKDYLQRGTTIFAMQPHNAKLITEAEFSKIVENN